MPGPNTTGLPDTRDYNLGRGTVYFGLLDAAGLPKGLRDLGNCLDFVVTVAITTLEHQSSRQGLKIVDKQVVIEQKATVKFKLDEINYENIAAFFSGTQATPTNPAVAGFTTDPLIADGDLALGRWYNLRTTTGVRAYDVLAAAIVLTTREGSPVTLVKDTDYTLDTEFGRFFTISTSTRLATAIAAVKGVKVVAAADATSGAVNTVKALQSSPVTGALQFISANAANNDRKGEVMFHQISIKPDGDFSLIGDNWTEMGFTGDAEQNTLLSGSPSITFTNVVSP